MRTVARPKIEPENPPDDLVRAAGGIVGRRSKAGHLEIAVVHRPHRQDWSFPKGKLDPGETYEAGALREVLEETGYTCSLGSFLGTTEYTHRKGRPKVVAYWSMAILDGSFQKNDEVDELRWVSVDEAREVLTYVRDRELLDEHERFLEDSIL